MSQFPEVEACPSEIPPFTVDRKIVTRTLSVQETFYFSRAEGEPIGEKAVSLSDFARKLETIDESSLAFHFYRGDFEAWVRGILKDPVLAMKLSARNTPNLEGKKLRQYLLRMVRGRLSDLGSAKTPDVMIRVSMRKQT